MPLIISTANLRTKLGPDAPVARQAAAAAPVRRSRIPAGGPAAPAAPATAQAAAATPRRACAARSRWPGAAPAGPATWCTAPPARCAARRPRPPALRGRTAAAAREGSRTLAGLPPAPLSGVVWHQALCLPCAGARSRTTPHAALCRGTAPDGGRHYRAAAPGRPARVRHRVCPPPGRAHAAADAARGAQTCGKWALHPYNAAEAARHADECAARHERLADAARRCAARGGPHPPGRPGGGAGARGG